MGFLSSLGNDIQSAGSGLLNSFRQNVEQPVQNFGSGLVSSFRQNVAPVAYRAAQALPGPFQLPAQAYQAYQNVSHVAPALTQPINSFGRSLYGATLAPTAAYAPSTASEVPATPQARFTQTANLINQNNLAGNNSFGSKAGAYLGGLASQFNPYTLGISTAGQLQNAETNSQRAGVAGQALVNAALLGLHLPAEELSIPQRLANIVRPANLARNAAIGGTYGLSGALQSGQTAPGQLAASTGLGAVGGLGLGTGLEAGSVGASALAQGLEHLQNHLFTAEGHPIHFGNPAGSQSSNFNIDSTIHPEDQLKMMEYIDKSRVGAGTLNTTQGSQVQSGITPQLAQDAMKIAEHYNIRPTGSQGLADAFQNALEAPPVKSLETQLPNPQQLTPTEAKMTATELGIGKAPVPPAPVGAKDLGVVDTLKSGGQTSPELSSTIAGGYNPLSNKAAVAAAQARIASGEGSALLFAQNNHNAEANATAILLAKHYEAQGQYDTAANLMVQKAKQALIAGQGNQIYSLWDKLSPETVAQTASKVIEQYNATAKTKIPGLTPDQYQGFVNQAQAIQGMAEGRDKGLATQKLQESLGRLIPSSAGDKAWALFRTGLLTGTRTPGKVALSNAVTLAAEQAKNLPTSIADIAVSAFTGQRSMVATPSGLGKGAWQGTLAAVDNLLHGYNAPGSGGLETNPIDQTHFSDTWYGHLAQNYVDIIGRLHGSIYKPFFGAQHLNSLMDIAMTNARNAGLSGEAQQQFVTTFVSDATKAAVAGVEADKFAPTVTPEGAAARAQSEAKYTTNQNQTLLGEIASGAKMRGGLAAKGVAPFTGIPSAIATKLVDYSPVGPAKELIQQINAKQGLDQRSLVQAVGRGITGTAIMYLGLNLAKQGLLTGAYPTDKKTQDLWQLQGKIANAFKGADGKWHELASLGSVGDTIAVGGAFLNGLQGNKKTPGTVLNAAAAAAGTGVQTIFNSPTLQGLQNISDAVKQGGTTATKTAGALAASVIPTGIANIASATDPLQRQVNTIPNAIEAKIPGLRQNLLPKLNALGQPVERANSALGTLLDPTYASQTLSSPVIDELQRLANAGINVTPTEVAKSINIHGQNVQLTPYQQSTLQLIQGRQINSALQGLLQNRGYLSADDATKQKIIQAQIDNIHQGISLSVPSVTGNQGDAAAQLQHQIDQLAWQRSSLNNQVRLGLLSGNLSVLNGLPVAQQRSLIRSVETQQLQENLTPIQKELYGLSKANLKAVAQADPSLAADVSAVSAAKGLVSGSGRKAKVIKPVSIPGVGKIAGSKRGPVKIASGLPRRIKTPKTSLKPAKLTSVKIPSVKPIKLKLAKGATNVRYPSLGLGHHAARRRA